MATSNTPWQNLAGHNFDGRYPLHAYLYSEGQGATYQTEAGPDRLPATIRFVPGGPQDAAAYLESWSTAASLNHPNLLAVYDYGHGVLDDAPVVYVVSAAPDNRLADVLSERALNEEETLEVATAVVEALVYLHAKGLAQGSLDPSHVFAVDDKVKIASDHIRLNASPAGDMESFGLLLAQCLTGQDAAAAASQISRLSPRFRRIIANATSTQPSERWTAARVRSVLQGEPEPVPAADPESSQGVPGRKFGYAAIAAAAVILLTGGGLYLANSKKEAPEPVTAAAPAPAPAPVVQKPSAALPVGERARTTPARPVAAKPLDTGNQYVIIATYNRREDAEKRAKSLTAKWPKFPAEVHAPNRNSPPYLVTIGANLSKTAAAQLQRRARAAGLPRDTYFQSF